MTQVISQRETLPCVMVPTKYKKRNWKLQDSESRNSEFRKLQNSETGFQNRKTGILKVGNWTGKLQDSEFRKLQNLESGNCTGKLQNSESRNSEFRKLDRETSEFRKLQNSESGNWMLLGML